MCLSVMDFGAPRYGISKRTGRLILWSSRLEDGWSVLIVWKNSLTNVQVVANLTAFRDYYYRQWLPNRERVELWNQYERDEPRTTNHAEGYHRGLSSVFDTRRRLPLGIFFGKMQELHNEIRQTSEASAAGGSAKTSPSCFHPK